MHSLESIPEPSSRLQNPETDESSHQVPLVVQSEVPLARPGVSNEAPTQSANIDAEKQVDHLAILLVLLIAGGLLRIVLGLLGPLQGIDPIRAELAQTQGKDILAGDATTAFPLFDLFAHGVGATGLPAWVLVMLGSLLTLASVPAAYIVGRALTGRPAAGIVAAAVIAVHPGVLAAANSYAPSAITLGLVTIGLALVCMMEWRGTASAWVGGILLGLAGLAAPLCWLIGALAGPVAYKLSLRHGTGKALSAALLVSLLAIAPAAAYRTIYLGHDASTALVERNANPAITEAPGPMDQVLVAMTSTSFQQLGNAMHLPLGDAGRLKVAYDPQPSSSAKRDVVADTLADGWLLVNAALAGLAAISAGVMLARRRFAETLLLAIPLVAFAFTTMPPTEALRLPMIALVGVLATGLLATRSVPFVDENAREAKRLAKLAKQEAKDRAKQERELAKHKDSLYAFDTPTKAKPKKQPETEIDSTPEGILTQHHEEAPQLGARPI